MSVVNFEPSVPSARRSLARYLRDLANVIDADLAEVEPNAALIVLTGRTAHEVVWTGGHSEPGFLRGALAAAVAVIQTSYPTMGDRQRPRTHIYGSGRRDAEIVSITKKETQP